MIGGSSEPLSNSCRQCGRNTREPRLCPTCRECWDAAFKASFDPDLCARWVAVKTHRTYRSGSCLSGPRTEEMLSFEVECFDNWATECGCGPGHVLPVEEVFKLACWLCEKGAPLERRGKYWKHQHCGVLQCAAQFYRERAEASR